MLQNYFKTAWRNLKQSPVVSFINIAGLALGMAVAIIIGLWIWNELSFDKNFTNYKNISQVMLTGTFSGEMSTDPSCSVPIADQLRNEYGSDFKRVALITQWEPHIIGAGDKKLIPAGIFSQGDFPGMFSLTAVSGFVSEPKNPGDVLISASLAKSLFGSSEATGKTVRIDNKDNLQVAGVYKDFPKNSSFFGLGYIASFNYYLSLYPGVDEGWNQCQFSVYVQLQEGVNNDKMSAKIAGMAKPHITDIDPVLLLHPMSKWHLYETFKNGHNTGGKIQYVWMFGWIGVFVLLLACINFMNLSTAKSQKRAKEVGVLKAIGVGRKQLITRFITESILMAFLSFTISILIVKISLPWFNSLTGSNMSLLVNQLYFWISCLAFVLFTGLIAGCYPAFYLSSFLPAKVLKSGFKAAGAVATPRKVLVVIQFFASVFLIIATLIVLQQLNYVRNRPLGYSKKGLINIPANTTELKNHYDVIRNDLMKSGAVANVALSSSPVNKLMVSNGGYFWQGMNAKEGAIFGTVAVTEDFANTVQWQFKEGRNFSRDFLTDSTGVIVNEMAANYMGMKQAVGKEITFRGRKYNILGVIENTVMGSPFVSATPTAFFLGALPMNNITISISPALSTTESLEKIKAVFKKYNPAAPFDYAFIDQQFGKQFTTVETIGTLTGIFAILAIFISCLGLYGLASFVAEQRTKELGIRKVLGASVFSLWQLLSKEFIVLASIAFLIAIPAAYWSMSRWLDNYVYRITISWNVFALAGLLIIVITIVTVSFQAIKAALSNPVESLRTE